MDRFIGLAPVIVFLTFLLYVSYRVQKASAEARSLNFAKDYFIGGRTLGGFVLARSPLIPASRRLSAAPA